MRLRDKERKRKADEHCCNYRGRAGLSARKRGKVVRELKLGGKEEMSDLERN